MIDTIKRISDKAVTQAKKDAKRLSKSQNIPHHEALDVIARKLGFTSWPQAMRHQEQNSVLERTDCIVYRIPGAEGLDLTLFPYMPIGYLVGYSGSGKTLLLRHMCLEFLKTGRKVVIAGTGDRCVPLHDISVERGLLTIIGCAHDDVGIDLAGIMAMHNGSIIVLDEYWLYKNLNIPADPKELKALCNLHNCYFLASSQAASDFPNISDNDYPPLREKYIGGLKYVPEISFVLHFNVRKPKAADIIGVVEKGDYKNVFTLATTKQSFEIRPDGGFGHTAILHLTNSMIDESRSVQCL